MSLHMVEMKIKTSFIFIGMIICLLFVVNSSIAYAEPAPYPLLGNLVKSINAEKFTIPEYNIEPIVAAHIGLSDNVIMSCDEKIIYEKPVIALSLWTYLIGTGNTLVQNCLFQDGIVKPVSFTEDGYSSIPVWKSSPAKLLAILPGIRKEESKYLQIEVSDDLSLQKNQVTENPVPYLRMVNNAVVCSMQGKDAFKHALEIKKNYNFSLLSNLNGSITNGAFGYITGYLPDEIDVNSSDKLILEFHICHILNDKIEDKIVKLLNYKTLNNLIGYDIDIIPEQISFPYGCAVESSGGAFFCPIMLQYRIKQESLSIASLIKATNTDTTVIDVQAEYRNAETRTLNSNWQRTGNGQFSLCYTPSLPVGYAVNVTSQGSIVIFNGGTIWKITLPGVINNNKNLAGIVQKIVEKAKIDFAALIKAKTIDNSRSLKSLIIKEGTAAFLCFEGDGSQLPKNKDDGNLSVIMINMTNMEYIKGYRVNYKNNLAKKDYCENAKSYESNNLSGIYYFWPNDLNSKAARDSIIEANKNGATAQSSEIVWESIFENKLLLQYSNKQLEKVRYDEKYKCTTPYIIGADESIYQFDGRYASVVKASLPNKIADNIRGDDCCIFNSVYLIDTDKMNTNNIKPLIKAQNGMVKFSNLVKYTNGLLWWERYEGNTVSNCIWVLRHKNNDGKEEIISSIKLDNLTYSIWNGKEWVKYNYINKGITPVSIVSDGNNAAVSIYGEIFICK